MKTLRSDVAIIGGGFGGVAAALVLADRGLSVTMTEEFAWIGGQATSQALCVLDDLADPIGETVGVTRRYSEFRNRVRQWYTSRYELSSYGKGQLHLCPGNALCSHLSAEPQAAWQVLTDWLRPALASGKLSIRTHCVPQSAIRDNDRVCAVVCKDEQGQAIRIEADFFLDATETGDTFPLLNVPYRLGTEAKSEFNEPHAPPAADRRAVQSFTYCIVVEYVPRGNFVISKPRNYEHWRDHQKFYLSSAGSLPGDSTNFFKPHVRRDGMRIAPFWNYRSVLDTNNFAGRPGLFNRAVINVGSNDYHDEAYLEHPRPEEVLAKARELSASYLYWLQTEAPRDDGGSGYPELRPVPECTGTPDGIAQAPYVREGRRIAAAVTVTECDLSAECQHGARARFFRDSVGLGGYAIDIHQCANTSAPGVWQPSRPYQIPLGALVTSELSNFAVAGKCIGVSHIANGAYRLHPEEWSIGEAAGELAAWCLQKGSKTPHLPGRELFEFQRHLVAGGTPLYWYEDLSFDAPGFAAAQILAMTGVWSGDAEHLRFDPQHSLCAHKAKFASVMARLAEAGIDVALFRELNMTAHNARKYDVAHSLRHWLDEKGWPQFAY
ncbi:MAG TPA: FAD-dependent oxidoreductase [Planctomycetota bacterium]|nr:FAD-dependent oxidoreductase [Planctomycetota bacterium]